MSGVEWPLPPRVLGVQATSRALQFLIDVGKSDLRGTGKVRPATWAAIDDLTDQLIELLPARSPRRV